jgi:hypothetical protein
MYAILGAWQVDAEKQPSFDVRFLSTARYILAHDGAAKARAEVGSEEGRSFLWTGELFDLLGTYEVDREHYATLDKFMPKVVAYFEGLAPRIQTLGRL